MATNTSISAVQVAQTTRNISNNMPQANSTETQQLQFGKSKPVVGKELPDSAETKAIAPGKEELKNMVSALNEVSEKKPPHMKFTIDEDTGHTIVTMTQRDTGEVVRQIPSEEFINIAKMILESTGSLADETGHFIEAEA